MAPTLDKVPLRDERSNPIGLLRQNAFLSSPAGLAFFLVIENPALKGVLPKRNTGLCPVRLPDILSGVLDSAE